LKLQRDTYMHIIRLMMMDGSGRIPLDLIYSVRGGQPLIDSCDVLFVSL
jgi:hypothetical protein